VKRFVFKDPDLYLNAAFFQDTKSGASQIKLTVKKQ